MTPADLGRDAREALKEGGRLTLVRRRGSRPPKGFPRGEFLSENADSTVYSYDPARVLKWLEGNGLLQETKGETQVLVPGA